MRILSHHRLFSVIAEWVTQSRHGRVFWIQHHCHSELGCSMTMCIPSLSICIQYPERPKRRCDIPTSGCVYHAPACLHSNVFFGCIIICTPPVHPCAPRTESYAGSICDIYIQVINSIVVIIRVYQRHLIIVSWFWNRAFSPDLTSSATCTWS